MNQLRRIGLFLIGLSFGILLLIFFLGGKRASCNYFPNERVLSHLRNNTIYIDDTCKKEMLKSNLDSLSLMSLLQDGKVDFSKSEPHMTPCKVYSIFRKDKNQEIEIKVWLCDSVTRIRNVSITNRP